MVEDCGSEGGSHVCCQESEKTCFFRVLQVAYLGNGNDDWDEICVG